MVAGYTVVVWEGKLRVMMDVTSDARAVGYGRGQILEQGATTLVQGTCTTAIVVDVYYSISCPNAQDACIDRITRELV
jgi:hypothetical protein